MDYFNDNISNILAKIFKEHNKIRIIVLSLSTLLAILLIFYTSYAKLKYGQIIVILLLLLICYTMIISVIKSYYSNAIFTTDEKLSIIQQNKVEIEEKIIKNNGGNLQDIIRLNLNQLDEYYTINKSQSKKSYSLSVFSISFGWVLLAVSIVFFFMENSMTISILICISSLLAEFIGATSLTLYKSSIVTTDSYLDELTNLQKIMLAIELSENLEHDKKAEAILIIITKITNTKKENISK